MRETLSLIGKLVCLSDPESYAVERFVSLGHPSQTGQGVEARQILLAGPPGWGFELG